MKKIIESYSEDKMMKEKKEVKKSKTTGKTKKWYEKLSKLTEKQLKLSNSIKEFKENFIKSGYSIKFSEKNITVTDKEARSVRLKTLDKTYTNEYIIEFFENKNKQLIKIKQTSKRRNKKYNKNNPIRLQGIRREFGTARFTTRKFR